MVRESETWRCSLLNTPASSELNHLPLSRYYEVRVKKVSLAMFALALATGCARREPAPPLQSGHLRGGNVLLVTIDTLRRDRLGAYGNGRGLTPTLDRLASSGVRFTHAFSHAPMTLPAHTSILTGRTPRTHGVHANGSFRLDDGIPTLATVLEHAGYRTGAFVGAFVLDARFGLSRGFDDYDDRYPHETDTTFRVTDRRAAEVVKAAGDWILPPSVPSPQSPTSNPQSPIPTPWFAWVHLFDPHAPYDAPAEYRAGRSPYDAEVAYTDAMLGQLLGRLGAAHALDRTVILVTADHGESLGDHGETTHGLFAYDSTLAVPLIVSGTTVGRGVIDAPVAHADILPTIVDLLDVASPANVDGQSVVSPPAADRAIYFEALEANLTRGWAPLTGVVAGDWKYIDLPVPELYDLGADPGEQHNVVERDGARRDTLQRALAQLTASRQGAAAPAGVDADVAARLRSLGYTAAAVAPRQRQYGAVDDPKRLVALNERFNTALEMFNSGRSGEALSGFLALVRERPDFITARTSAATVLITSNRANDAIALLRDRPEAQASAPEILAKLGAALQRAGDLKGAADAFERSRAAGNQNPEIFNDLGVVYAQSGRVAEARAMFQELLRRDPNAAGTWTNLGLAELSAKRLDAATDAFRHAVAADPSNGEAWQGLGAAAVGRDVRTAIDAWQHAERLQPGDYDLLFNLGMVLADSDHPADALPYLTRFVQEAPRARYARDIPRVEAAIAKARR
jgi:arylsulfatase A-like enzyme/Flp pilus assembly protein TadD